MHFFVQVTLCITCQKLVLESWVERVGKVCNNVILHLLTSWRYTSESNSFLGVFFVGFFFLNYLACLVENFGQPFLVFDEEVAVAGLIYT